MADELGRGALLQVEARHHAAAAIEHYDDGDGLEVVREDAEVLPDAVVVHLEVVFGQIGLQVAGLVDHRGVQGDRVRARTKRRCLLGGGQRSGEQHPRDKTWHDNPRRDGAARTHCIAPAARVRRREEDEIAPFSLTRTEVVGILGAHMTRRSLHVFSAAVVVGLTVFVGACGKKSAPRAAGAAPAGRARARGADTSATAAASASPGRARAASGAAANRRGSVRAHDARAGQRAAAARGCPLRI